MMGESWGTLSKIGVILFTAGIGVLASGDRHAWLIWALVLLGLVLTFAPDIVAYQRPRRERRRLLDQGVEGWRAEVTHAVEAGELHLTLTPPADEEIDGTIGCEVRLPSGGGTAPVDSVLPPGTFGAEGRWNDFYSLFFPKNFQLVAKPLAPGEYVVTWSRSKDLGRQGLRRSTFEIDEHGAPV